MTTSTTNLGELRKNIDNLDTALVAILAERFRITERVGELKRTLALPAEDKERERAQNARFLDMARSHGQNSDSLLNIMHAIIDEVKKRHHEIARNGVEGTKNI